MSADDLGTVSRRALVSLVDDNAQNLELLTEYLEDLGCELQGHTSGAAALEAAGQRPPDLVVLDVMMPRISGFQVCERLRSDQATAGVPILMVTALNEAADVERALEVGADDFLIKPIQRQELLSRVRCHLRVREVEARLRRAIESLRSLAST
jgi:two-component system cell cycle response regulator